MLINRFKHYEIAILFCMTGMILLLWVRSTMFGFGPIDDHVLISTIFQGKSFGFYISKEMGRFFPLLAQEYVILARLFEPTPLLFNIVGLIKIFLVGLFLLYCLILTGARHIVVIILWLTVMFSVGMANASFRLQVGEINILLLTLIFLMTVFYLENNSKLSSMRKHSVIAIGIAALTIALFYKEIVFTILITFALFEISRMYQQNCIRNSSNIWLLLSIGFCYAVFIIIFYNSNVSTSYANFHQNTILQVIKNYILSDPFIVLIICPLAIYRTILIISNKNRHTLYDSFLVSAMVYFVSLLLLKIHNTYYLLPVYGFATCGLAGLFSVDIKNKIFKTLIALVLFFTINNIPIAFSDMQSLKLTANNHWDFICFLSEWIVNNPLPNDESRNLVLAGVSPGYDIEIIISLAKFLESKGLPDSAYNVKATEPSNNATISNYYSYNDEEAARGYKPKKGDLLIFNPYQSVIIKTPFQAPSYKEIYRSKNAWAQHRWSLLDWIKNWEDYYIISLSNLRYVGYSAMLVIRDPAELRLTEIKNPNFILIDFDIPKRMRSGMALVLIVTVQNLGNEIWPANGKLQNNKFVNLSYRWFDSNNLVIKEGNRVPFPEPIQPKDIVKIPLSVKMPRELGKYKLVISPVQEGIAWFPFKEIHEKWVEIY
jgi:hypothetical protein